MMKRKKVPEKKIIRLTAKNTEKLNRGFPSEMDSYNSKIQ
jgi:hypothetical protein